VRRHKKNACVKTRPIKINQVNENDQVGSDTERRDGHQYVDVARSSKHEVCSDLVTILESRVVTALFLTKLLSHLASSTSITKRGLEASRRLFIDEDRQFWACVVMPFRGYRDR